jgi:two-component system, chemotaxis family, sensor kinase CheA
VELERESLLATFAEEVGDLLSEIEETLVALEEQPDEERLRSIFRAAHTVKGAAVALSYAGMADVAHGLEDVLELLLERRLPAVDEHVTLLLEAVDRLRAQMAGILAGAEPPESEHQPLIERLGTCCEELRQQVARPVFAPPVDEPPIPGRRGRTLRVDVDKLDLIATLTGELAIAHARLTRALTTGSPEQALAVHEESDRLHEALREEVMRVRMVPVGPLFRQHLRTVRDLTRVQRKWARLVLEGEDVEVDTALVEGLREPLLHLMRNAVDHGLETPEERRLMGKEACGTLVLRAFHEPGALVVQLSDDGRGLPLERLREHALARGLQPERMSISQLHELVFVPGLSTADAVTELSGRGVGMDVVRRAVEGLRGHVGLSSEPGRGTTVTLRVPLTLATIAGFGVGVGEETYVLPLDAVHECLALPPEHAGHGGAGVLSLRGGALPFLRLRELLQVGAPPAARESVVVLGHAGSRAGLVVDTLLGESPCVLKPLGPLFRHLPGVSGSTLLGDGRVGLVLDVPTLLRSAAHARVAMDAVPPLPDGSLDHA